jgi:hypothetical protein
MISELARDDGRDWRTFLIPFAAGQTGRIGRLLEMLLNLGPRLESGNAQIQDKRSHTLNWALADSSNSCEK